jgi:hypothetical protein
VIDLIRKLAAMKGDNCDSDPESWYKVLTGAEPDYSDILDHLTHSSGERAQLLRSYFEPNDEDREQGRKMPSAGHRAIATLVAKGYIRVIVTTNFDRLMEQALTDAGIQPTIISTADAVKGALPLTHSPCTVMKIHGDYLDSRLRNTKPELSAYEKPLNDLLDRVLDEFGLVVCGWSAEWDVALRATIERCSTHRFGTYWAAYKGNVSSEAEKLIGLRRAAKVPIENADSFFHELAEKIRALDDFALSDPLSAKVAVARMKRYLAMPDQKINLHDLVHRETERVQGMIVSPAFPDFRTVTSELLVKRLRAYEREMEILLALLACGGYWASGQQTDVLARSLKRLADDIVARGPRIVGIELQKYPATLALYAMGIAAIGSGNYLLIKDLLALKMRVDAFSPEESLTKPLAPMHVLQRKHGHEFLPGRERQFTPFNDYVFEILREPLRDYIPDDKTYDEAFDWFEYLLGMVHCDLNATPEDIENVKRGAERGIWGPVGRFLWKHRNSAESILARTTFVLEGPYPRIVTAALSAGMFASQGNSLNYDRFHLIKRGFDVHIGLVRDQIRVW